MGKGSPGTPLDGAGARDGPVPHPRYCVAGAHPHAAVQQGKSAGGILMARVVRNQDYNSGFRPRVGGVLQRQLVEAVRYGLVCWTAGSPLQAR